MKICRKYSSVFTKPLTPNKRMAFAQVKLLVILGKKETRRSGSGLSSSLEKQFDIMMDTLLAT